MGETVVKACGAEGVSWRTLTSWKEVREFARSLAAAEAAQADLLDEARVRVAQAITPENSTALKAQIDAIERRMAALDPSRYGRAASRSADDEEGEVVGDSVEVRIYLPDNGRDPGLLAESGMISLEERAAHESTERRHLEVIARKDEQLRRDIRSGKCTVAGAIYARSFYTVPGDPLFEVPVPAPPPQPQLFWYPSDSKASAPTSNGAEIDLSNGNIEIEPVVLFTHRRAVFQVRSGRVYRADEQGKIWVADDADIEELVQLGCRSSSPGASGWRY
jgi:hypothetical protein